MISGFILALKRFYWTLLRERWRLSPARLYQHYLEIRFDRTYNLDTVARVTLASLEIKSDNREFGRVYTATPIGPVRRALRSLKIRYQDFVLIDLGSGKGRILLLASEFAFKRIVGVEFSPWLNAIAIENIGRYPKCAGADVSALCADAGSFEIPAQDCVIFMARPFAEPVVEKVVGNIAAALAQGAGKIIVIYFWPVERAPFERRKIFRVRASGPSHVVYEADGPEYRNALRARHQP